MSTVESAFLSQRLTIKKYLLAELPSNEPCNQIKEKSFVF